MKKLKSLLCFALVFVTILSAGFILGGCNDNETPPTPPDTENITPADPNAGLYNTPYENDLFEIRHMSASISGYSTNRATIVTQIMITNKGQNVQTFKPRDFYVLSSNGNGAYATEFDSVTIDQNTYEVISLHFSISNQSHINDDTFEISWLNQPLAKFKATYSE